MSNEKTSKSLSAPNEQESTALEVYQEVPDLFSSSNESVDSLEDELAGLLSDELVSEFYVDAKECIGELYYHMVKALVPSPETVEEYVSHLFKVMLCEARSGFDKAYTDGLFVYVDDWYDFVTGK